MTKNAINISSKYSRATTDKRGIGYFRVVDICSIEKQVRSTKPLLIAPLGTTVNPPFFIGKSI